MKSPLGEKLGPLDKPLDRVAFWYLAVVLAASVAMGAQTLQWMRGAPSDFDRHSLWEILRGMAFFIGHEDRSRWMLQLGGVVLLLAFVGLVLRRSWGVALALWCSALLLSVVLLGRHFAISQEPRQFVAKSIWVKAATLLLLIMLATHGVAALASLRLLARQPSLTVKRVAMALLALSAAAAPVARLVYGKLPPMSIVLTLVAIAAAVVVIGAVIWPRRQLALAALVALAGALLTQVVLSILLLGEPSRRHRYSAHAEDGLAVVLLSAPSLLALIALLAAWVIAQHRGQTADLPDSESAP